ncbi:hypothetical protein [Bacillus pseudomycoides]|uniref:hypothetical protein n=1 Tax=Bacillus pseudomycoides TaxID=64104 RepID=UPI000BF4E3BC|nr:hypothetical protein [Bacillus pseudomycoides]PGA62192.1 hypothetical protein COL84_13540 [Bacillus pseudomycoides]
MDKLEIANELFKNSYNVYIKEFIEKYLLNFKGLEKGEYENEDDGLIRLHDCISYIKEKDFDIRGWGIWEIPIFYAHVFSNKTTNEFFDLAVWDIGKVIPRYIDEHSNEQDAKSIEEAIKKYSAW